MKRFLTIIITSMGILNWSWGWFATFGTGSSKNYDIDEYKQFNSNGILRFLHEECENGKKFSCVRIADKFYYGIGVKKDLDLAFRYYKKACDLGVKISCSKADRIMRFGW